jgi:hypothetical protein
MLTEVAHGWQEVEHIFFLVWMLTVKTGEINYTQLRQSPEIMYRHQTVKIKLTVTDKYYSCHYFQIQTIHQYLKC